MNVNHNILNLLINHVSGNPSVLPLRWNEGHTNKWSCIFFNWKKHKQLYVLDDGHSWQGMNKPKLLQIKKRLLREQVKRVQNRIYFFTQRRLFENSGIGV